MHRRKGRNVSCRTWGKEGNDSKVEFIETMSENYPILKDIKFDVFRAERNAKEMVFNQPPSTGYSAIYLKMTINQGRHTCSSTDGFDERRCSVSGK